MHANRTNRAIQTPACDRCTQGVMDATNNHLLGICRCECHLAFRLEQDGDVFRCVDPEQAWIEMLRDEQVVRSASPQTAYLSQGTDGTHDKR